MEEEMEAEVEVEEAACSVAALVPVAAVAAEEAVTAAAVPWVRMAAHEVMEEVVVEALVARKADCAEAMGPAVVAVVEEEMMVEAVEAVPKAWAVRAAQMEAVTVVDV